MLSDSLNDNILYWHYSDFRKYQYFLLFSIVALITFSPARARSQIIPDNTLPNNSITISEGNLVEIGGGTIRGENLFHSFSEFSVPENNTAWFNNSLSLENIFSRVTGGNISNIEGLIQTNGTANLFLLNPAGIIFGKNAALNVGGSLFVSTADSLIFSDGSEFSAVNPQEPPLLTVNIPIGLQYGSTPGQILVQGSGHGLFGDPETFAVSRDNRPVGLQVPLGKTLALLGGEVRLEGGNVTAEAGNIEVWAVANNSQLLITNSNDGFAVEPASADVNYGDINLSQAASIDVSSNSSGNIRAQGRKITITEGSTMAADTLGDGTGGLLEVTASELITLNGTTSNLDFGTSLSTEIGPSATGQGSDLIVNTERLLVSGGAAISSSNLGLGMPGDLIVNANNIELTGGAVVDGMTISPSGIFSQAVFSVTGNSGDITINTEQLSITEGANISTLTVGGGNAGAITINAQDMEVQGTSVDFFPSAISTSVFFGEGDSGKIEINTEKLLVTGGANIISGTFDVGNAAELTIKAQEIELVGTSTSGLFPSIITTQVGQGATGEGSDLKVETQSLKITDGAQINTITFGEGNAGNLNVNANESVELLRASSDTRGGLFASAISGTGDGGNLNLTTKHLTIENGATISVSNFHSRNLLPPGEGAAGNLNLQADTITLENGIITAEANSGAEGNISITSDQIILRNNSLITSNARGEATGGNIAINIDTLTALENSDITANAVANFAGRVDITATGIFGTQFREQLTPKSDITASSSLGANFNGVVQLNTPDVDPTSGLIVLPSTIVDPNNMLVASCPAAKEGNVFVVTGKGGLPENPTHFIKSTSVWHDLRRIALEPVNQKEDLSSESVDHSVSRNSPNKIIEAQGWIIGDRGQIILTATSLDNITKKPVIPTPSCQTLPH